jgi:hypothetical protein
MNSAIKKRLRHIFQSEIKENQNMGFGMLE